MAAEMNSTQLNIDIYNFISTIRRTGVINHVEHQIWHPVTPSQIDALDKHKLLSQQQIELQFKFWMVWCLCFYSSVGGGGGDLFKGDLSCGHSKLVNVNAAKL